jgi:hypothetical protein
MTEKKTRRRRAVLVPLLAVGVAAWAVRSRLAERPTLQDGWQQLPPRPVTAPDPVPAGEPVEPVAQEPVERELSPAARAEQKLAAPIEAEPAPSEPLPLLELPVPEAVAQPAPEPVPARVRAVPAATAVASVTAPVLPDAPFGPGSVRAAADGSSPDADHVVKGKTATRVFYAPGSPYYARTRADVWFRTADDARAAGFAPRAPRRS